MTAGNAARVSIKHNSAFPRRGAPELCIEPAAQRGRGECRVPVAPAASCAHGSGSMHTSIHSEFAGITRHSRMQWFTAYTALSSEIGLSCLRRLRRLRRKLDTSVEVSGPHDFAVRLSAIRQEHIRVHRIPSRVRDDRDTPLGWDETAST